MKRMYAFMLHGKDTSSENYKHDLRLIAGLLYGNIYNYYGDNIVPLNINKNIKINNLHEDGNKLILDSDTYDDGFINYEPFIISDRSFALTVDDELMNEEVITKLVDDVLKITKLDYKITFESETYYSKDVDDERYRLKAIGKLCKKIGCKFGRKLDIIKRIFNSGKDDNVNYYRR